MLIEGHEKYPCLVVTFQRVEVSSEAVYVTSKKTGERYHFREGKNRHTSCNTQSKGMDGD